MDVSILRHKEDLEHYLQQLKSPDSGQRREAAERLADSADERAVYPLTRSLYDENLGVQQVAVDALCRIEGELAVYCTLPMLRDDNAAVRNMAVEILQKIGPSGFSLLVGSLKDRDPDVRKMIADILGILHDPSATEPLIQSLSDTNNNVRASAAAALGLIGNPSAVHALIESLKDEEWVAFFAAGALGKIGDPCATSALIDLIRPEHGASGLMVKIAALEALGEIGDPNVADPLIALLESLSAEVRGTAVKTLIHLCQGNLSDLRERVDRDRFLEYLLEIYRDVDPEMYSSVIQTFDLLGHSKGCRPVLELASEMNLEDPEILQSVLKTLVGLHHEETLVSALTTGTEKMIVVAVKALGLLKSHVAVPHLMALHSSAETELQVEILLALGEIGGPDALKFILSSLEDEVGHVRRAAVYALGEIGDANAMPALFARLNVEEYRDVMSEVVKALISIGRRIESKEVVRGLTGLMSHPNPDTRESIAKGLGKLDHPEACKALLSGVNDPDWKVRKGCMDSLGRHQGIEVTEALTLGTCDEKEEVKLSALLALGNRKPLLVQVEEEDRIVMAFLSALHDDHVRVRCRAVEGLGRWGARRATPYLMDIVQKERGPIQIVSITALGAIKATEAEGLLRIATSHQDPAVCQAAADALLKVVG